MKVRFLHRDPVLIRVTGVCKDGENQTSTGFGVDADTNHLPGKP